MTAKEFLKQALTIDQRINDKLTQASKLREMATQVTSVINDMPKSHNPHKMENVIVRLVDTEKEIDADIDRLTALKIEIMNVIWQVEDADCRTVLELRYHSFKTWEDIAAAMNVSVRWVHKLHSRALDDIDKKFSKKFCNRSPNLSKVP